jgi:carbon monoxide dehydrogenase subunit G
MLIQDQFDVSAPIEAVWLHLLDVERVAPCAPGAELTEVVDDRTWKGKVVVKLGPISMVFVGTVVVEERDEEAHRVVLRATGREQQGRGSATAMVTSTLQPIDTGTRVAFDTDLTLSGLAAQFGRGMVGDICKKMTGEFASCLQSNIVRAEAAPAAAVSAPAQQSTSPAPSSETQSEPVTPIDQVQQGPVKGLRLGLWAFWRAMVRVVRRVFGRPPG